jgi:hypothetical protein
LQVHSKISQRHVAHFDRKPSFPRERSLIESDRTTQRCFDSETGLGVYTPRDEGFEFAIDLGANMLRNGDIGAAIQFRSAVIGVEIRHAK